MPTFSMVDLIILALLAWGTVRGVFRGLSGELAHLLSLAVAVWVGWQGHEPLGQYLEATTRMESVQAHTVALIAVIIGALLLMWALFALLRLIMSFSFRTGLERIGGALAGFIRYALWCAVALLLIALWAPEAVRVPVAETSYIGSQTLIHILPRYEALLERHPDWPLPKAIDEPPPVAEPAVADEDEVME